MTPAALPPPLRRAVALGLVVLALALAGLVAFAPFVRWAALSGEAAAAAELIAQQERLLEAAARRPKRPAREVLLAGETGGMAGAELQRVVVELARKHGLSLKSAQVTLAKREADLMVVGVEANLHGHTEGLRAFVHAVETGTPILFIEALSIRPVPSYQPTQQPMALDVTLKVRGYGAGKETN